MDSGRRFPWLGVGVAAAVLALILAGALFFGSRDHAADVSTRVAAEIARNHQKHADVAVESTRYEQFRDVFEKLDFAVVAPHSSRMQGLSLVGARYCSVQGHVALQMRLQDEQGERVTLYQVRAADTFSEIDDGDVVDVLGLHVELWRENGVLLGLARPVR